MECEGSVRFENRGPPVHAGGPVLGNQHLMAAAHDQFVMLKGAIIAALVLTIASQVDQYLSYGRYTDGAFAMLREIRHSFGI